MVVSNGKIAQYSEQHAKLMKKIWTAKPDLPRVSFIVPANSLLNQVLQVEKDRSRPPRREMHGDPYLASSESLDWSVVRGRAN